MTDKRHAPEELLAVWKAFGFPTGSYVRVIRSAGAPERWLRVTNRSMLIDGDLPFPHVWTAEGWTSPDSIIDWKPPKEEVDG